MLEDALADADRHEMAVKSEAYKEASTKYERLRKEDDCKAQLKAAAESRELIALNDAISVANEIGFSREELRR
jgi:hypothetical protein